MWQMLMLFFNDCCHTCKSLTTPNTVMLNVFTKGLGIFIRVVVIEFWHGFIDYNYLSLNRQLIPITITRIAYE